MLDVKRGLRFGVCMWISFRVEKGGKGEKVGIEYAYIVNGQRAVVAMILTYFLIA